MITIVPPKWRGPQRGDPRGRSATPTPTPTPTALSLVAAEYSLDEFWVRLTFDRPVSIAGAVPSAISVIDGTVLHLLLVGDAVSLSAPAVVQVGLSPVEGAAGDANLLSATGATGIVAVDDGQPWAGVTDVELPFP